MALSATGSDAPVPRRIEEDEAAEACQPSEKGPCPVPHELQVTSDPAEVDEIDGTVTDHLIGHIGVADCDVVGRGSLRHRHGLRVLPTDLAVTLQAVSPASLALRLAMVRFRIPRVSRTTAGVMLRLKRDQFGGSGSRRTSLIRVPLPSGVKVNV